mgnify:CR=1 FL=1
MKVRIISGAVAVVLLVVVLLLHKTIVFPLCIAAICAIAIFELFRAKGCLRYRISFMPHCSTPSLHRFYSFSIWNRLLKW